MDSGVISLYCIVCFIILIVFVYITNHIKSLTKRIIELEIKTQQLKDKTEGLKIHSDYLVGIMNDHIDETGVEKITFGR